MCSALNLWRAIEGGMFVNMYIASFQAHSQGRRELGFGLVRRTEGYSRTEPLIFHLASSVQESVFTLFLRSRYVKRGLLDHVSKQG